MLHSHLRSGACLLAAIVALGAVLAADVRGSKQDAAVLLQKVVGIAQFAEHPAPTARRTTITEKELNAYLAYEAGPELPAGVVDPAVTILGSGRVSGRAVVDLDAVRKQSNPQSMLDPMSYLTGRLPLTLTGVLQTSKGVGRFTLETATVGGVPVPNAVLQQIVSYYSRSPETPNGISLDDPFSLPAHIREIQVEQGQAVIIQ